MSKKSSSIFSVWSKTKKNRGEKHKSPAGGENRAMQMAGAQTAYLNQQENQSLQPHPGMAPAMSALYYSENQQQPNMAIPSQFANGPPNVGSQQWAVVPAGNTQIQQPTATPIANQFTQGPQGYSQWAPGTGVNGDINQQVPLYSSSKPGPLDAESRGLPATPSASSPTKQSRNKQSSGQDSDKHSSSRTRRKSRTNSPTKTTKRKSVPPQPTTGSSVSGGRATNELGTQFPSLENPPEEEENQGSNNETSYLLAVPDTGNIPLSFARSDRPDTSDGAVSSDQENITKAIGRMYSHLKGLKIDGRDLKLPNESTPENLERALHDVTRVYEDTIYIVREHEATITRMETEIIDLQAKSKEELSEKMKEESLIAKTASKVMMGIKEAAIKDKEEELAKWKNKFKDQVETLQEEHEFAKKKLIDDHQDEIRRLNHQLSLSTTEHATEITDLTRKHLEQTSRDRKAADKELDDLRRDLGNQLYKARKDLKENADSYQYNLDTMVSNHEEQTTSLRLEYMDKKRRLNDHFQEQEKLLKSQLNELQQLLNQERGKKESELKAKDEEIARLCAKHKEEKATLETVIQSKYKTKIWELQNKVQEVKGALVARDSFKVMSDHELSSAFENITSEVDQIARVEWDRRHESSWPFPKDIKSFRDQETERVTKQYLIQNTIWFILFDRIFFTPFRLLGDHGRALENDWIKGYNGPDPHATRSSSRAACPKPTKASESWRHEEIRKCAEAINQALPERDPNFHVKRDFLTSLNSVTEDILQELRKVAPVSNNEKQRISELVMEAAKFWLDAGQQRFRAHLLMSRSEDPPARSRPESLDSHGMMDLVVMPELRRIGNGNGERLEKDELVVRCIAQFETFSMF